MKIFSFILVIIGLMIFIYFQDKAIKKVTAELGCTISKYESKIKKRVLYLDLPCLISNKYLIKDKYSKVGIILNIKDIKAYKKYFKKKGK